MNKQPKKRYSKSGLTPAKKKFAEVYAKTDNGTEAVRQAFPELPDTTSPTYMSVKANRLIRNDEVSTEITRQKNKIEQLATRAVEQIANTIETEDQKLAFDASKWVYEQVHGKAIQKTTSVNAHFYQHLDDKRQAYNL